MPHRAEQLLQQQKQGEWLFERMPRQIFESSALNSDGRDLYDLVYDDQQQGVWYRKKQRTAMAPRDRSALQNQYRRPVTRFADLMDGVSHIARGLQKLDHATDGDLGQALFDLLH